MLLYHHIVVSLRSQTPTLDPITKQFQKTFYVTRTTNFIIEQLVLMSAALRENNQAQALVCINGVCNSCRDETWKPHYQALRFFLVRLHERKEHPRRLQVAAQGDQRGVLAAAPQQACSRRPHARKGI